MAVPTRFAVAALALLTALALSFQTALQLDIGTAETLATAQFVGAMTFIVLTVAILHRTTVHPYIFFALTASLFLGGRFVARLLGSEAPVFYDEAFKIVDLSATEALALMSIVTPSFLAIHAGYMLFWGLRCDRDPIDKMAPESSQFQRSLAWPATVLLVVSAPLAFHGIIDQYQACFTGDYLSIYAQGTEFATRFGTLGQYGILLATGLAFASRRKWLEIVAISVFAAISLATFGLGIRSGFLAFILLATWMTHKRVRRLNVLTIFIVPALALVLAQGAAAFSCRTSMMATEEVAGSMATRLDYFTHSLVPTKLLTFAHSQGTSIISIHAAGTVDSYPWPAYVQTFVPGFGAAASISGTAFALSDLYFGQHMAKEWMPDRYALGEGFGWSIVSDLAVFSNKNHLALVLFGSVAGFAFAALVSAAARSALWFGALVVIMPKLVLLPRAGLYSIFPYLLAFLVIAAGWWVFMQIVRLALAKRQDRRKAAVRIFGGRSSGL
ncbi:O-antigen polysaccharide polymerase Wzy [Devosia sp.]|uniref:O-antigen polysaccharide polymerase Wzy n=1 Tax=Devosia sp. TaxID=1871048 RepID=UPI002600D941|nr:O-antigen polysaccharide polymerase Wzy [Devosia sp.]MCR6636429.1 O-antigen polysaccharide polymerase Wzy family protein [Devosia sp.]